MSDWLVSNTGQGKRRIEPAAEPDSTHITTIGESTEVVTEPQHGLDDGTYRAVRIGLLSLRCCSVQYKCDSVHIWLCCVPAEFLKNSKIGQ